MNKAFRKDGEVKQEVLGPGSPTQQFIREQKRMERQKKSDIEKGGSLMTNESKKESMLQKHSKTHSERVTIMQFLEWLGIKEIDLCYIPEQYKDNFNPRYCPISKTKDALLDQYFEIDAAQLEKERRELIASIQTVNKVAKGDGRH